MSTALIILVIWLLGVWILPEGALRDVWAFGPMVIVGLLIFGAVVLRERIERMFRVWLRLG